MKKKLLSNPWGYVCLFFIMAVLLLSSFCGVNFSGASAVDEGIKIRAYGDSISAGYGLADYQNYLLEDGTEGKSQITKGSYAEIFSRKYIQNFGGQILGKGVSGDTSSDLAEILRPYINGSPADKKDFASTDIFTLCIGANNILGSATSQMQGFLTGSVSEEQFQALLDEGVAQFKGDYPTILSAFSGKRVVVMTVYNPYKYTSLNDITISPLLANYEAMIRSALAGYEAKFQRMVELSMTALQEINDTIRESAGREVYVADIWKLFEGFDKTQYLEYINADISQVTLASADISSVLSQLTTACDPHPTAKGHEVIAEEHLSAFKYFDLKMIGELEEEYEEKGTITFTLITFEEGEYSFEMFRKVGYVHTTIATYYTSVMVVPVTSISGEGEVYVKVYDGENEVYTTNSVEYDVNVKIIPKDNPTGSVIMYVAIALVAVSVLIGLLFFIVRMSKRLRLY